MSGFDKEMKLSATIESKLTSSDNSENKPKSPEKVISLVNIPSAAESSK